MSYYRWYTDEDIVLVLTSKNDFGSPMSASEVTPIVSIQRLSNSKYWDGATFQSTPQWLSMSLIESGAYKYTFSQSLVASSSAQYGVYIRDTTGSDYGFEYEMHLVSGPPVNNIAAISASVWNATRPNHATAGTMGQALQFTSSFIDIAISSRSTGSLELYESEPV